MVYPICILDMSGYNVPMWRKFPTQRVCRPGFVLDTACSETFDLLLNLLLLLCSVQVARNKKNEVFYTAFLPVFKVHEKVVGGLSDLCRGEFMTALALTDCDPITPRAACE